MVLWYYTTIHGIILQCGLINGIILLQPLRWCCVDCVIHHERNVREEQHHTYMWREQAIIERSWHVNSIVACCHSAKLCAYATRDFRSQQYYSVVLLTASGPSVASKSRIRPSRQKVWPPLQ